jgi:hypothetical protein
MGVWLALAVAGGVVAGAIVWIALRPRPRAGAGGSAGGGAPAAASAALAGALPVGDELDQDVEFTVYRPRRMAPHEWHTLLAFAHRTELVAADDGRTIDPIEEVARQATAVLAADEPAYAPAAESSSLPVPRGGDVTFVPVLPGCEVNPPHRTFTWNEPVHREEFRIRPTSVPAGETVRGHLAVYLGAVVLAEVNLSMQVEAAGADVPARVETQPSTPSTARRFERVFLSYSHKDSQVVDLVESLNILNVHYVRDSRDLRSGEDWRQGLESLIRSSDRFQLFWSRNSMASPEVANEWRYALSLDRADFIRPVYWEEPRPEDPVRELPPAALNRLHFQLLDFGDDRDRAGVTPLRPPTVVPASAAPAAARKSAVPKALAAALGAAAAAVALVLASGGPHLDKAVDDDVAGPVTGDPDESVPVTGEPVPTEPTDATDVGGGEETVAALVTSCTGADLGACDRLFAATDDGDLVALAASCGGASSVRFAGDCARHFDAALEAPAAACAGGDMGACDDLAGDARTGTPYGIVAGSCGGRRPAGESTGACLTLAQPTDAGSSTTTVGRPRIDPVTVPP